MYLVFDTETTGLPKNYKAPMTDVDNWPRVIQLAWAVYDKHQNLVKERCDLIRPDGWVMPTGEFWQKHGFTHEKNEQEGIPIREALAAFIEQVDSACFLIAHNISYDYPVLGAEMMRAGMRAQKKIHKICTKDNGTDFCKIPGPYGYKWPTLTELHNKLFGCDFEGAHDALHDVKACAKCLFGLGDAGVTLKVM